MSLFYRIHANKSNTKFRLILFLFCKNILYTIFVTKVTMNYTTYLFDFDYTLADSSRGIVTCFRNVLTRHGYTEVTDDDIKRTIGKTLEDSFPSSPA